MIHPINRFEIELSLKLGIPISQLTKVLTRREYELYHGFYLEFGFGEGAEYVRSANQIITIANYISAAVGGKPKSLTPEDIYPQLSTEPNKKRRRGNCSVNWDTAPERIKQQLIANGLYTDEGDPVGYNPHGRT